MESKVNKNLDKKNIIIKGDFFTLTPFSLEFVTARYLSWLHDKKINKYLAKAGHETSLSKAKEYCDYLIQSPLDIFLAIVLNENNLHVGNVRLGPMDFDSQLCKFSMMIGDSNFHGKGLGTSILELCIDFVFNDLQMNKFYLDVVSENKPALRVYEKCGMIEEGFLKNHLRIGENAYDLKILSLFNKKNQN
tara:strand:- start:132 stop:704 length:573 start_codon:yes stop_codon:yes gene_type:complete